VTNLSAERRSAVRDAALEKELASLKSRRFGVAGNVYSPATFDRLPAEAFVPQEIESFPERIALWNTWEAFTIIILFLLLEWALRKWVHLP
jgi:hypothetical protein